MKAKAAYLRDDLGLTVWAGPEKWIAFHPEGGIWASAECSGAEFDGDELALFLEIKEFCQEPEHWSKADDLRADQINNQMRYYIANYMREVELPEAD